MNSCNCKPGLVPVNEPFFCPRMQAYVVRGPRGATGAQGPQGPRGLNGALENNITLATAQELGVIAQGAVPFTQIVTQNGTAINAAVGDANIVLPRGTFMIIYGLSAHNTNSADFVVKFALSLDDEAVDGLASSVTAGQNQVAFLGGHGVINVAQEAVLALKNISDMPVTISDLVFTVIKLV